MDKQILDVAFAIQRGGSGKTAIAVLAAGCLHYRLGCPLTVIDYDSPQYSLCETQERDSRVVLENEYLGQTACERMWQPGYAAYPVRECQVEQTPDTVRGPAAEGCYSLLFFDLLSTMNSADILYTITQMDYISTPVSADEAVLESALSFLDMLQRMMLDKEANRLKRLYLFWNQVDEREMNGLYERYKRVVADMGLPMLQTHIPDTKRSRKKADSTGRTVPRSTLLTPDRRILADNDIPELIREIATILKLEGYEETAE